MTTSIRIRRDAPHEAREQGGLVAAFVGNTQYVPAGSIEIEIQTDDVEFGDGRTSVGWVEDVAPVAAAAFRHADTGEIVSTLEHEATPQTGALIVDDAAKEEEVPFPEAGDSHPFGPSKTEEEADRNAHDARVQIVRRKVVSTLNAYGSDLPAEATAEKIMVEIQEWIR